MDKPNYKSNTGALNLFNVKTMKNLVIAPKGTDYQINMPESYFVQSCENKDVYDDNGNKTSDKHIVLKLIDVNVAKALATAGQLDALRGMPAIQCTCPVNYQPQDQVTDFDSLVVLNKVVIKPQWVDNGRSKSYASLRLECQDFDVVGSINDD